MQEEAPARAPISRLRYAILTLLAVAALFVFVVPHLVPIASHRLMVPLLLVVFFGPPLLPVRFRYKLLALVALLVLGPLLLPLEPLADTAPARVSASSESRFFDTGKIELHYRVEGSGDVVLMLLHPGQPSGLGSFQKVIPALASNATVVAFDRPGAGLTGWPEDGWEGESPYSSEAQAEQTVALMDHLGVEKAVLVGNSAGGTVALLTAVRYPERVAGLVLIAPGVYFGMNDGSPGWIRRLLRTPQGDRLGRFLVRVVGIPGPALWDSFWHDPEKQTAEDRESYLSTFRVDAWDRAFVELFRTARPLGLPQKVAGVRLPVLVLAGDDDQWVPLEHNRRLAEEVRAGRLVTIAECGHLPQQEQPEEFVRILEDFLRHQIREPSPEG